MKLLYTKRCLRIVFHGYNKNQVVIKMAKATSVGSKATPQKPRYSIFTKKQEPAFEPYWTQDKVQSGLKRGEIIQGCLRINQRNFTESYISDPKHGPDYFLEGVWSRNRALEGDTVVIQVLPEDKWQKAPSQSETGVAVKPVVAEQPCPEVTGAAATDQPVGRGTLIDKLYARVPARPKQEAPKPLIPNTTRRTAKVVYIVERVNNRAAAGYLKSYDKKLKLALFSPRDNRAPRVLVALDTCPPDFCTDIKKYESTLFVCRIEEWANSSPLPLGRLMRSLGEAGVVETESEAFLLENDVDYADFDQEVNDCLPTVLPWTLPQEEVGKRRDFRNQCVFTIDPDTARDLDDALHVKTLDNGNIEVGVHIADVSYFVAPGTALDRAASNRATSVYLVQRVIPMLPRLLCEHLCSLNPNEDKLTFSVVWTMSSEGELLSEWFGRSIIRSCAKLSYDHAQLMIQGHQTHDSFPKIHCGYTIEQVASAVHVMNKIAVDLRAQRQARGTLRLNQVKRKYALDDSSGLPNGYQIYQLRDSNRMIEEFMLMANMAVARRIHQHCPDLTMLRRHPPPKQKATEHLMAKLQSLGVEMDTRSAGAIQESLDSFCSKAKNPAIQEAEKLLLVVECAKIMDLAKYFCAGSDEVDKYHHYALNVPFYTHFTSPIRRYADIIVHRQLAAALGEGPVFVGSSEAVQEQAAHCNKKKKSAKTVEELSSELFLALLVKDCGPFHAKGIVSQVLDKAFDVYVPDFGVTKRIYCEKLPLRRFGYSCQGKENNTQLMLEWANDSDPSIEQVIKVFSVVNVTLEAVKTGPPQFEAISHAPSGKQEDYS